MYNDIDQLHAVSAAFLKQINFLSEFVLFHMISKSLENVYVLAFGEYYTK